MTVSEKEIKSSRLDTYEHIYEVKYIIGKAIQELKSRAAYHDQSKLEDPELSIFAEYGAKLKETTYGSEEYKRNLKEMNVALQHHYENNTHHPEHYDDGINGMDLFDVVEMLCDWIAAVKRHDDGDIQRSLKINKERFQISDQLYSILKNTIERKILE